MPTPNDPMITPRSSLTTRLAGRIATLESMLVSGILTLVLGLVVLGYVYVAWINRNYQSFPDIFLPVVGTLCLTLGMQNILGGFLMAIIGGHKAQFFHSLPSSRLGKLGQDRE